MTVFAHSQTTKKLVNEAVNDSARVSGQDRKIPPALGPIRLPDLEDSARSQAWKKKVLFFRTDYSKLKFVFHFFKAIFDTGFRLSRSFLGK